MGSITYRQTGGDRATGTTGQRTISSINAATGVVTTSVAIGTAPQVGSIMEIFGTSANPAHPSNKGYYTVTAVSGANYTLRPKPRNITPLGVLARIGNLTQYTLAANSITEIAVTSVETNLAFLRVDGCDFKDAGVRDNDRVQISGSTTTANNGGWIVDKVISNTVLLLRPPDKGEPLITQSNSGTIIVRHGRIRINVSNIGTLNWSTIATQGIPEAGPYSSRFYRFGSGSISDYIKIHTIGGITSPVSDRRDFVQIEGVDDIAFYQSAPRGSTFYSINEIVVATQSAGSTGTCNFVKINPTVWPGDLTVQLGEQTGNRYSAGRGSAWVGVNPNVLPTKGHITAYGSYLDVLSTNEINLGDGNVAASLLRQRANMGAGTVESMISYGDAGNASGGLSASAVGDQSNILLAHQGAQSSISSAGTITGLLISDEVNSPPFINISGGQVEFRDLRADTDITNLITNSSGTTIKTYRFFPRFVSRETSGSAADPIFYLHLTVYQIGDGLTGEDPTPILDEVTNILGYPENGANFFTVQTMDVNENVENFTHRIVLQGAGYKLINEIFQLTSPFIGDFPVDRIAPDYEGEFGE